MNAKECILITLANGLYQNSQKSMVNRRRIQVLSASYWTREVPPFPKASFRLHRSSMLLFCRN